jgi:subtilisin
MRRHVATFVAAALVLAVAAPVTAADPAATDPVEVSPSANPSPEPSPTTDPSPSAEPAPVEDDQSTVATSDADPTGRWIVLYGKGTDSKAVSARQAKRIGFKVDRTFSHAAKGFVGRLTGKQAAALRKDPSVLAVVPDEKISLTGQAYPTGINRIGARKSLAANINGSDERVDADVAVVDTGIMPVADLNVVGGYNCTTTDRNAWTDGNGHGTHVAGTVGALDNGLGVVGVAPGVRLWAVRILNSSGEGLLSWYVCGLDWIAAQRDPSDSARPLIEAVNMSVTKWGRDDRNCGLTNADILHQSICRLVSSGVTVVAAAANDSGNAAYRVPASYNEVITVSALADTDGKPGGLGGNRCYSWGSYDKDDTFANFSNYGGDVDLIAPGKCIWSTLRTGGYGYMSGTSMAAPHVAGAVALLRSTRPEYTPAEVRAALMAIGTLAWKTSTDPDSVHEPLLDVSRLGPRGDFSIAGGSGTGEAGAAAHVTVSLTRSATYFDRVDLSASGLPSGFSASFDRPSLLGFDANTSVVAVAIPSGTSSGTYRFTVIGREHDRSHSVSASVVVTNDLPTASPPQTGASVKTILGTSTVTSLVSWPAATDPSSPIAGYEVQTNVDGGGWSAGVPYAATIRSFSPVQSIGHAYQYRLRARDAVGNWSAWAFGSILRSSLVQNNSSAVRYAGTWKRLSYSYASGGSVSYATAAGAYARTTFTGRSVAIVGPVGRTRGSAKIYVDGVYRGTISFRSSVAKSRKIMYTTSFSSSGTHTIQLRLVGNGRVDLDAFVVYR